MAKKSEDELLHIKGLENLDQDLTIPGFLIWLRKNRRLSQRELSALIGVSPARIMHLEKSRYPFPYKLLRQIYQELLTASEREYFLVCIKGHVRRLMEAFDDDEFREQVKTPNIIENSKEL